MVGTIRSQGAAWPAAAYVAVEVKRHATIEAVEQLKRYLTYLSRDPELPGGVRGAIAAQTMTPQCRTWAVEHGIEPIIVDYDALRGMPSNKMTLF